MNITKNSSVNLQVRYGGTCRTWEVTEGGSGAGIILGYRENLRPLYSVWNLDSSDYNQKTIKQTAAHAINKSDTQVSRAEAVCYLKCLVFNQISYKISEKYENVDQVEERNANTAGLFIRTLNGSYSISSN